MKKIMSLIIAFSVILAVAAIPAYAAPGDVVDGCCIHCGMPCTVIYRDIPMDEHYYVANCFEYNEPHYHTSMYRYYWYRCPTPDCATNEVLTLIRYMRLDDICHYGE